MTLDLTINGVGDIPYATLTGDTCPACHTALTEGDRIPDTTATYACHTCGWYIHPRASRWFIPCAAHTDPAILEQMYALDDADADADAE